MPGQSRQSPETSAPAGAPEQTSAPATDPSGGMGNAALQQQLAEASKAGGDDDFVRDTIGPQHLAIASAQQKAGMIVNLLDGDTGDEDEAKILEIIDSGNASGTFQAIEAMGHLEWLFDDVNGEEHERLKSLYGLAKYDEELAARAPAPQAPAAEAPAAQAPAAASPEAAVSTEPPAQSTPAPSQAANQGPSAADGFTELDDPTLSEDRRQMLELADQRMGSVRGEIGQYVGIHPKTGERMYNTKAGPQHERLNGEQGVNLFDGTIYQTSGTSCGLLAADLFDEMGVNADKTKAVAALVNYGVKGVEDVARSLKGNIWVESNGTNLPLPGDVYILKGLSGSHQHIGVVQRATPTTWKTADAGQGGGFVANYVDRHIYSKEEMEEKGLPGGKMYMAPNEEQGGREIRSVSGWVDLDALMARVRSGK